MSAGKLFVKETFDNVRVKTDVFTSVEGRRFSEWIDNNSRTNGYAKGDLINCPPYIIESLLRDENFVERDLKVTTDIDTNIISISGLKSSVDDYYNGAILFNATQNFQTNITDYTGSTKTLELLSLFFDSDLNDNVYLQNIQGDNKIDIASFDAVGNTTNGSRGTMATKWIFAQSFTEKRNIRDILDELCFESHCELVESVNPDTGVNQFKLVALDSGSGDTWTNPAYSDGLEQSRISFTPLENVFTQFRLRYFYDYGKGDYVKEIYVDKNGFPTAATVLSATEQGLCADAETNYKVSQLFEYSSRNIYDDATAEYFLQKKIQWFTKQRMIVSYVTPIVGNADYIKYEIGDKIKLNFAKSIPTGINNSSYFMITAKRITPLIGGGYITWELLEL